jgi:aspartate kinase
MIVQNVSADGKTTDMTFTVPRADLPRTHETIKAMKDLKFERLDVSDTVAKVSVVGVGMRSHSGVANTMFKTLADKGINIQVISTSEIKISVLIEQDYVELAVRSLHAAYGLED